MLIIFPDVESTKIKSIFSIYIVYFLVIDRFLKNSGNIVNHFICLN